MPGSCTIPLIETNTSASVTTSDGTRFNAVGLERFEFPVNNLNLFLVPSGQSSNSSTWVIDGTLTTKTLVGAGDPVWSNIISLPLTVKSDLSKNLGAPSTWTNNLL